MHFEWKSTSNEDEFSSFINHSYKSEKIKEFSTCLQIGGFRLGKTLLFISADDKTRRVVMISSDAKMTPNFESNYDYYHYTEDI